MFRLRQNFTAKGKNALSSNEQQVMDEISATVAAFHTGQPSRVINRYFLEKLMRTTHNPDFFAGLPMQSAQKVLFEACDNFKGWLSALKTYKSSPELFTGKPKMPGYTKNNEFEVVYTNQDCVIYYDGDKAFLKFPLTKIRLRLGILPDDVKLKEVKVIPYYGNYMVITILESADPSVNVDMPFVAAMDTGVDNIAAIVSNSGKSGCIYKGGPVKSCNQWFNKCMAYLKAVQMKGHDPKAYHPLPTKQMMSLSRYRDCFINDFFHKTASCIVKQLVNDRCGTLVVGVHKQQKQGTNIGHINNQTFVAIPFFKFRQILKYLCERSGIVYIEREESYTSKASLLDMDYIPTYGKDDHNSFSGKRITRGLYRSKDGVTLNADINAAGNILRKEFPDAFDGKDLSCLKTTRVVSFGDLYLKRKPVTRLVAV